jgi:hypothetical protein
MVFSPSTYIIGLIMALLLRRSRASRFLPEALAEEDQFDETGTMFPDHVRGLLVWTFVRATRAVRFGAIALIGGGP